MFNYGSFKLFLLKISTGIVLINISLFLFISILTHSPLDPGIGRLSREIEVLNFFGLWGAIISSFFLVLLGRLSLIVILFLLYLGFLLSLGFKSNNYFLKLILVIISSILINFSLFLSELQLFETGLISIMLFDVLLNYLPGVVTSSLYKFLLIFSLVLISVTLLLFCFSIKLNLLNKIFFKILNYIFLIFLKTYKIIRIVVRRKKYNKKSEIKTKNEPTILKKNKILNPIRKQIKSNTTHQSLKKFWQNME